MTRAERWEKAITHARERLVEYMKLPLASGWWGVATIQQAISLYEAGDRSTVLLYLLERIE